MTIGFVVPTEVSYNSIYENLLGENCMMAASCIGQCTGCTCSCKCSCKALDNIGFEW